MQLGLTLLGVIPTASVHGQELGFWSEAESGETRAQEAQDAMFLGQKGVPVCLATW